MSALLSGRKGTASNDLFLFVDLDNFKAINDTGGHAAGDVLLKRVADAIREATRAGDIAARIGGDEFAVILRDCDVETGTAIAERLIAAVNALSTASGASLGRIGASIGLTTIGRDETDVDAVIARADLSCYEAKAAGRGRVAMLKAPQGAKRKAGLAKAS
jgi:diguanylate cyclase (GGDEF)-like protein